MIAFRPASPTALAAPANHDAGDLVTFMLDTQTGHYGFNQIGPDGTAATESGRCQEVR